MSSTSSAPGSYRQPLPTGTSGSKAAALPVESKDGCAAARNDDSNGSTSSTSYPMANPCMHPFFAARAFMPMMPFGPMMMPEMVLPAASKRSTSGKSASVYSRSSSSSTASRNQQVPLMPPMLPMMPPFFPHPAQIQAMSAAAQAAMAHASKTGMPFPPGMMLPPFMFPTQLQQQQQAAVAASRKAPMPNSGSLVGACTFAQPVAGASTASLAAAAAGSSSDDDEEDKVDGLDESIEVDAETEQLFEKVAALERERAKLVMAQAPRADSPSPSIHSACTRHPSSHPCSPKHTAAGGSSNNDLVSAAVFEEAASLPPAATGAAAAGDAVPLPWLSFAADDGVDDIDRDLAQIITLPEAYGTSTAAAAAARPSKRAAAGAADRGLRAMKRVRSISSAVSTGDALGVSAAATSPGTSGGATASPGAQLAATRPRSKLIKIKTTRGLASTAGTAAAAVAAAARGSSKAKLAKNHAGRGGNSKSCSQVKRNTAAAAGLGAAKAGAQKKSSNLNSASNLNKSQAKASAAAAAKAKKSTSPSKLSAKSQQLGVEVVEPCLGILDELQSSLSDTCFGVDNNNEDMAIDSFEYLGALLQEPSPEDAWDGLLTTAAVGTADDVALCAELQP